MLRSLGCSLALLSLLACDGTIANGTGASAGAGGGGGQAAQGGEGGTIVPAPPCDALVQTGPLVELPPYPDSLSWQLRAVRMDAGRAALVRTIAIPGMGPQATVASIVDWTGTWPPASAPPVTLADRPWYHVASGPDAVTLALLGAPKTPGLGISFGFADAVLGDWTESLVADPNAHAPSFLAHAGGEAYFLGVAVNAGIPSNSVAVPHLGWVDGTAPYVGPLALGCPTDPVAAAGIAVSGGWLFAHSVFDQDCAGPNAQVTITHYDGAMSATAGDVLPAGPWDDVLLLPRPGGAWLFIGGPGQRTARLDASGVSKLGPVDLLPGTGTVAVDALDGGLLFAAEAQSGDPMLEVGVADDDLQSIASVPLALGAGAQGIAVLFEPTTRDVLVAVVLPGNTMSPTSNVHLARFSCP